MSRDGFGVKSRGWVGERGEWLNWHSGRRLPDTSVHITIFLRNKKASGFAGGFFAVCPFLLVLGVVLLVVDVTRKVILLASNFGFLSGSQGPTVGGTHAPGFLI